MIRCDTCGNEYAKPITVTRDGRTLHFDSFECAIQAFAPICGHCGVRILGHGVEDGMHFYCCANCARSAGASGFVDHL